MQRTGGASGAQKIRCGPATGLQSRLPSHGLHCLIISSSDTLRNVLLHECFISLSSLSGVRALDQCLVP